MLENQKSEYIKIIDDALKGYLCVNGETPNGRYDIVKQAMLYSISAGGKRLRPMLTLELCRACGGTVEQAVPFACAVEMIHCYSLIHDDLPCMDDDDLRRGKPSCHIKFGEANALLAGDALLTLAFEVIASAPEKSGVKADSALKASLLLSRRAGVEGMVGGQVIDLMEEGNAIDAQTLELLQLKKTSALLCAAVGLGCIAAGLSSGESYENAVAYAAELGLAFQIVDDILDVTGDEKTLGKPIGSDAENQKTTYVSLYGIEKARELAELHTKKAMEHLEKCPNTPFLKELTNKLLKRDS